MDAADLWTDQWTTKLVHFLFWIRLRGALRGCRNLLRTSAREGGTGTEPRIRTVRQLTAAAGDGLLGSVGSPGQLETSLNSGYLVGPCNSYLEGPTPICLSLLLVCLSLLLAQSRLESAAVVVARRVRTPPLAPPPAPTGRDCRRSQQRCAIPTLAAGVRRAILPTLAAHVPGPARTRRRVICPTLAARVADPAPTGRRNSRAAGV